MTLIESGTRIAKRYLLRKHLEVFARYGEGTDGAKIRQVAHADRQCRSANH
jgi:hypothetical protein